MQNKTLIIIPIFLIFSCSKIEISNEEKQLLLNEKAFSQYGFNFPNAPQGNYTKFKLPDGAVEIAYMYKGYALDSSYLYISNTITTDRYITDAEATYTAKAESINLSTVFKTELQTIEGFDFGDKSVLYLWLTNDEPVGNYFQFRQNNITYQLLLQGFYFSDKESWKQFFTTNIAPAFIAQ